MPTYDHRCIDRPAPFLHTALLSCPLPSIFLSLPCNTRTLSRSGHVRFCAFLPAVLSWILGPGGVAGRGGGGPPSAAAAGSSAATSVLSSNQA